MGRLPKAELHPEQQASTSTALDGRTARELLKLELKARVLNKARAFRDLREVLHTKISAYTPEELAAEMSDLDTHIEEHERRSTGGLVMEDLLKDPEYNRESLENLIPNLPRKELKELLRSDPQEEPLRPIDIRIDDGGTRDAKEEGPNSMMSMGDGNVEKAAKMEAHVVQRVAELRKQGLWTMSRLPLCVDPPRNKTQWDYLLEEVKWMANDFRQERNFKRNMAKKYSQQIAKIKRDQEMEVERAEQKVLKEGRKICANIAKIVRDFWQNVDKVVEFRAQEILESKKRKALDQHLAFIVGEADKLSSMVQEGLTQEKSSKTPSVSSKQDQDDREFTMNDDEVDSDNESTLSKEEEEDKDIDHKVEIDALNDDAEGDIDDMLAGLPAEYLASLGITLPKNARSQSSMSVATEDSVASSSMETDEKKDDVKKQGPELNGEGNGDGRGVLTDVDYAKLNSANADEREQELAHIAEQALQFQPKGFTLETTQVKTQVPFLIRGTLREYQLVGLDWLVTLYEKNLNGILADEMGLGKTIQTISLLAHLACSESIWGPHLIVVPTSVILNWEMELKKWCPAFKILTYFGTVKERAEKRKGWSKPNAFHICITSYKTITTDIRSFKMKAWQYMILDEAQNIKNWKSQRWQALLNVRARRRLLLTGTPLQNSLMELWSLMHFLMPAIFASHDDFKDWFSNPLTGMMEGSVEYNAPLVQRLHKILRPFILRRLKSEVEKQLPEKVEKVVKCELSKRQRYLYDDFMSRRTTKENLKTGNMFSVLNIVMQLRKCCNHPNLFEPRPVLSPFILSPIRQNLPACVFDIVGEDAHQEDSKPIPDCFNIRDRLTGWTRIDSLKKPTIEELKRWQSSKPAPLVEGFRLSVPALSRSNLSTVTSPAVSAAETQNSVGTEPGLPEPSHASLPRSSSVAEKQASTQRWLQNQSGAGVQQRQVVSMSSVRTGAVRRSATIHPAFKSTTQLSSSQQNLAVLTETKGFNHIMANGGSRESIVNYDYKFSPPMKRRKFQDVPLVSGPYSAYVPQDCREHLAEERVRKLELARGRFGTRAGPVFANELVYLLTRKEEETEEFRRLPAVQRLLQEHTETLLYKYPLYVDPVQVDAPSISALSKGRSVQAKMSEQGMSLVTRKHLQEAPSTLDSKMLASRLQFPELRLIEYDCGKLQTLALLLRQLYLYKHRCLIFTQMSRMLDILQAFLSHHGYQYFRLDGTTGIEQRQAMMERFNADNRIFCFILSTRSGGVGVNLTGADTVIFYDSDWNPTMDAQAQDRCHRIGQTRNVTIYRLISERTIEENILKKAMQKRRLGEMAIDDAGFTPDFFKEKDNIRDLFEGDVEIEEVKADEFVHDQKEMETAMASLEDEQDVAASKMAVDEARADRAEFDEAKRDTAAALLGGEDVDEKYIELINQLKPIERYAVQFLQDEYKPDFDVECKEAEAIISQKKEDWVRAHEKAINDETSMTEDDFYGCGSILDEVMAMDNCFPDLPTWCPPTPPLSPSQMQNDLYYDDCLDLLYDPDFMGESRLPSVIHDLHRPLMRTPSPVKKQPPTPSLGSSKNKAVMDLLNAATQSACSSASQSPMYTNDSTYYPEYGFQAPDYGTSLDPFGLPRKEKRDRSGKGDRGAEQAMRQSREAPRPITPPPPMNEAEDYEGPEWNIMEDMAIVEAIEIEESMGHVASRPQGALQYNWRYISDYVNMRTAPTGHFRSARQCCIRYQLVVRPREAGHLHTVDPLTKKPRKVPVTPAELAHLKKNRTTTKAQYDHDYPLMMENICVNKARLLKDLSKRNKKPLKSYLDALPAVADTKMPDNFEAKLQELKLAGALRTVLPEDMVRKQEEVHFTAVEAQSRQRATEKQLDTDVQKGMPASISIRRSAIPAQGMRESKAPYMLEMPVIHASKPPPPPPRPAPLSNVHPNTSIPQLMPADHPVSHHTTIGTSQGPRRVANPTMSHMVSSSTGGHNYVVVQNDHPNAMRVQRADTMGQQGTVPMFRGVQGQVRRAPANAPMNQRPVNYVSTQGQGSNYITSQQGTGSTTMYSGSMTQQGRAVVPPNSRVITRPGTQPNRIFVNSDRSGQYVMQQGHVRVVGAGQAVQRVQQGPSTGVVQPQGVKRVATKPGTMTTMVLPSGTRPSGQPMQQFRTIRTVQRGVSGPQQGPRVMNVVMGAGGPMRTASGHLVSQGGMTRQLLTSRTTIPSSRQGSPQTIAQVVIAPPSGMQQRDHHPSQPPTLTPQQIDPHPPPGRNSPQVQHVGTPVSSATASQPHDGTSGAE